MIFCMRPADVNLTNDIVRKLASFQHIMPTPGIIGGAEHDCLVRQIVDSVRRIEYVNLITHKHLDNCVLDPTSIGFNPIKAASVYLRSGNIDEAGWLIFLTTHFGRHSKTKWQLIKNVYGALGQRPNWTWDEVVRDVAGFRIWLSNNEANIKANAKFGPHRSYQSISATKPSGTGAAIETYVNWVQGNGGHAQLFGTFLANANNSPRDAFASLYDSMSVVRSFSRLGKFDYLTMIGKVRIANIEPNSVYMNGATGPYSGAELLFGSRQTWQTFDTWLSALEAHLGLYFGMQVLEDALCNWQKSPAVYKYFGG